jgi:uncharacterized protein YbjT (DUF2867 family)
MQHKAWVAGATGFVGQAVVAELLRLGVTTVAHVRPDSLELETWRERFGQQGAVVDATPWEPDGLASALQAHGITHVFCLIGTTRARKQLASQPAAETYEAIDYGLTRMLAQAVKQAGGVQRLVYLSSMGVSATAPGAYMQARWKAETAVRESGVPWTLARPAIITGNRQERRVGEHVAAVVSDGLLAALALLGAKAARERYRSTTDLVLGRALVRLAFDPQAAVTVQESECLR